MADASRSDEAVKSAHRHFRQGKAAQEGVEAANWERLKSMQAVKRQGTADDIANLGYFLASEQGSFINNQVILCDGGHQLRGFRI